MDTNIGRYVSWKTLKLGITNVNFIRITPTTMGKTRTHQRRFNMRRNKLQRAVKRLLDILDQVERTKKGVRFYPVKIQCTGADLAEEIHELLRTMKKEV